MPAGRFTIIRGVPAGAFSSLPKIRSDATDIALGSVVDENGNSLLRYDIDPTELAAVDAFSLYGKERGSGKIVSAQRSGVGRISADATFNNSPVIVFGAGSGDTANQSSDLKIEAQPTASFTAFFVVSIAAALKNAPTACRLFSIMKTGQTVITLSMLGNGGLNWGVSGIGAESASIATAAVPAADVPFILAISYGRGANRVRIYMNNGTLIDDGNPAAQLNFDSAMKMGFGGPAGFSTGLGFLGKMARGPMFDGELPGATIDTIMSALRTKYGVA